jgi:hypothetical protein
MTMPEQEPEPVAGSVPAPAADDELPQAEPVRRRTTLAGKAAMFAGMVPMGMPMGGPMPRKPKPPPEAEEGGAPPEEGANGEARPAARDDGETPPAEDGASLPVVRVKRASTVRRPSAIANLA